MIKVCVSAIYQSTGLHHLHKQHNVSRDVMPGKSAGLFSVLTESKTKRKDDAGY